MPCPLLIATTTEPDDGTPEACWTLAVKAPLHTRAAAAEAHVVSGSWAHAFRHRPSLGLLAAPMAIARSTSAGNFIIARECAMLIQAANLMRGLAASLRRLALASSLFKTAATLYFVGTGTTLL